MKKQIISLFLTAALLLCQAVPALAVPSGDYSLTGNGAEDTVAVATAQLGHTGADFGWTSDWSVPFVCWAGRTAGAGFPSYDLETPIQLALWFLNNNRGSFYYFRQTDYNALIDGGLTDAARPTASTHDSFDPKKGDLICCLSAGADAASQSSRIALVTRDYDGSGYLQTIEGGSDGRVTSCRQAYDATVAGFIRPYYSGSASPSVPSVSIKAPTDPDYVSKLQVGDTNAVIVFEIDKTAGTHLNGAQLNISGEDGLSFGRSVELKDISDSNTRSHVWFDLTADLGLTLTPNTKYSYSLEVSAGGWRFAGPMLSFTTTGASSPNTASCTVALSPNGGVVSPAAITVASGQSLGSLPIPVRSGYAFNGWYTRPTGGILVSASRVVTENMTLYAQWSTADAHAFIITFDANGGSVSPSSMTVTEGGVYGPLPVPAREGYAFSGWYTALTGGSAFSRGDACTLRANQTLYAHWTAQASYTITFDPNGGSVSPAFLTIAAGGTYGALPVPLYPNHLFTGWYTHPTGGTQITSTQTITESRTLYAHWSHGKIAFSDVQPGQYFYEPVLWAVERSITAGTTATTFSPYETCTRGQIITFLWRAYGSPEASASQNPFSDVRESDYCYPALLWAYSRGIVTELPFRPDAPCTRRQTVVYLWRAAGSPTQTALTHFTDVPANAEYAQAVSWAVSRNITAGTSATTFSPNTTCTRGQIMTFLYKDLGG